MSALMAERRDWAEDPRQASLFDALAPPPERAQPGHGPEKPREVQLYEASGDENGRGEQGQWHSTLRCRPWRVRQGSQFAMRQRQTEHERKDPTVR